MKKLFAFALMLTMVIGAFGCKGETKATGGAGSAAGTGASK